MKNYRYYTLIASLPHLKKFDNADRLPITRERLVERLKLLESDDYELAECIADFIAWRRQPEGKNNKEIASVYNSKLQEILKSAPLKSVLGLTIDLKTIITALRERQKIAHAHYPKQPWNAGPLVKHIERNWDHPYFKLQSTYPWIVQAATYLQEGKLIELEYLIAKLTWDKLELLSFKSNFSFDVVIAYLLKWDILRQWLSYNEEAAQARFEKLVSETIHEYAQQAERKI
jgi:hypothetical protein